MGRLGGVLVRDKLLDLASPVDDDGLEALDKVLVFNSGVDVVEVLVGDVEVGHTLLVVAVLGDYSHKGVQVGHKLLLDIFWPLIFSKKLGAGLVHHLKKRIKGITVADASNNLGADICGSNASVRISLDEICDLVVFSGWLRI